VGCYKGTSVLIMSDMYSNSGTWLNTVVLLCYSEVSVTRGNETHYAKRVLMTHY
jgi:hypothetical protein